MSKDQGTPVVGEGATIGYGMSGADREPGTVIEVTHFKTGPNAGKPKTAVVQMDRVECSPGAQDGYTITPDPDGRTTTFVYQRHRGGYAWKQEGMSERARVSFGHRSYARDPHY